MGDKSSIEWTDATWNPIIGCTRVIRRDARNNVLPGGCDKCYAFAQHDRRHLAWRGGNFPTAPKQYHQPFGHVQLLPERLVQPFKWSTPKRVFVNSLSDAFHDAVPIEYIARMWAVMALTPQHTYQVLTKRPGRARLLLRDHPKFYDYMLRAADEYRAMLPKKHLGDIAISNPQKMPLENVWLGTSTEDQRAVVERIPYLLQTPAAVRFISAEPLLNPLDLRAFLPHPFNREPHCDHCEDCIPNGDGTFHVDTFDYWSARTEEHHGPFLDWVIVGGESGIGARAMQPAWVRSIRDQCVSADVAFFFKQWGGRTSKSGGRELDGREWSEYPKASVSV